MDSVFMLGLVLISIALIYYSAVIFMYIIGIVLAVKLVQYIIKQFA